MSEKQNPGGSTPPGEDDAFTSQLESVVGAALPVVSQIGVAACLNAARILREVFAGFGIKARTVAVDVLVGNAAYAADVQRLGHLPNARERSAGAWSVGIATEHPSTKVGHVVTLVRGWIVDLTVQQFSRPAKNINPPEAFVAHVPPTWVGGEYNYRMRDGLFFAYKARPLDTRFEKMPGYQLNDLNKRAVAAVIKMIAEGRKS